MTNEDLKRAAEINVADANNLVGNQADDILKSPYQGGCEQAKIDLAA